MFTKKFLNAFSDFRPTGSQGDYAKNLNELVGDSPYSAAIKFSSSYPLYTFNATGISKSKNEGKNMQAKMKPQRIPHKKSHRFAGNENFYGQHHNTDGFGNLDPDEYPVTTQTVETVKEVPTIPSFIKYGLIIAGVYVIYKLIK